MHGNVSEWCSDRVDVRPFIDEKAYGETVDKIVVVLKKHIRRVERAEASVAECMKSSSLSLAELGAALERVKGNRHAEARLAKKIGVTRARLPEVTVGRRDAATPDHRAGSGIETGYMTICGAEVQKLADHRWR